MARSCLVFCLFWVLMAGAQAPPVPLRILLLDGESAGPWHQWQLTTPVLRRQLEATGLFRVDVLTIAPATAGATSLRPDFTRYQAVVLNYDAPDERWSASLKASFEAYMRDGGGLVIVHAADNAFPGWPAFNAMTGVGGWRDRDERAGPYWYLRDGQLVPDASPGPAGSHGLRLPFAITRRAEHPITRGLPPVWWHGNDELYAQLRGPGAGMTVLASAYSEKSNAGTGRDEPVLMVISWGRGRVFHTTLGHDVFAVESPAFRVTFQRGTEWAASGEVTQAVPADLPSANSTAP